MSRRDNIVVVSSTTRAVNKAKSTGKLHIREILAYEILNSMVTFVDELTANGSTLYTGVKDDLLLLTSELVYRNPTVLCSNKITTSTNNLPKTSNPNIVNTAPTVSPVTIAILEETSYTFKVTDFTNSFTDAEGDSWEKLIIYPTGLSGTLLYNGVTVTNILEINVSDVTKLIYVREDEAVFSESIPFRISDNNTNRLYSSIITNTITGTVIASDNLPATLGDNTIYVDNRVTTVLSLAMFTSLLQPPYNDPEGDLIDAIRIDDISTANTGIMYLNGVEITIGTIITREELAASLFTHIGPDDSSLSTDSFAFSARDEGSLTWVQ